MAKIAIALGSNLGNRAKNLDLAQRAIQGLTELRIITFSSFYETDPVGGPSGQNRYLNAALIGETTLSSYELLANLHRIEHSLGRTRSEINAPRTIDLDLLFYDQLISTDNALQIPHPRLHERLFVLQPLAEIAPDWLHPIYKQSVLQLLEQKKSAGEPLHPVFHRRRQKQDLEPIFTGKRCLITGSTRGIGKGIAERFAELGCNVIIHGRKTSAQQAIKVQNELKQINPDGSYQRILKDFTDVREVNELITEAWDIGHGLDFCICNAGADTLTEENGQQSFDDKLAKLWAVDVQATVRICREIGSRMKKNGYGVILTMGWDQAETGMEGDSGQLFALIKGAIMCFTRSLACELAPKVRANCLAPGWIKTSWGEQASPIWQKRVKAETPLKRWGLPEDVAAMAAWLCSDDAAFQTGQIMRINGGVIRS